MAQSHREGEKFNLKIVHDKFEASLQEEDDVDLELYLESFQELNKFFTLMGTVFNWVSKDLRQKIDHLNDFLKEQNTSHKYKTVKRMIEHEKENSLLDQKGYVSGCRTLLRVHRGLNFIQLFLKRIGELEDHESTSDACREAYNQTLAKHHTYMIRKGATFAMHILPIRGQLLKRVCGDEKQVQSTINILPEALAASAVVYTRVETLYNVYELHDLP